MYSISLKYYEYNLLSSFQKTKYAMHNLGTILILRIKKYLA